MNTSVLLIYLFPLLAVVVGYIISLFLKPNSSSAFKLILAFSGAYLLAVTVLELLPNVYSGDNKNIGIFILLGLLLQIILEFLSKGVEHGHLHDHQNNSSFPYLLFISLSIHSILEGFPLTSDGNLVFGVVVHKIPVAAIIAVFLIRSDISRIKSFLFLGLFALMTPLGSWLNQNVAELQTYENEINAVVIGIFLHISTTILFESSKNHSFNASKLGVIVLGILLAYFM